MSLPRLLHGNTEPLNANSDASELKKCMEDFESIHDTTELHYVGTVCNFPICILLMLTICFKVFPQDISQCKDCPLKGGHTVASSGHQSNTLNYTASFWKFMTIFILWNWLTEELNFACVGHKELQTIYHLGNYVVKCTKPGEWASIHAPSIVHFTTYFSPSPASTWEAWLLSTWRISKLIQRTFPK